jgi:hypothetical protein
MAALGVIHLHGAVGLGDVVANDDFFVLHRHVRALGELWGELTLSQVVLLGGYVGQVHRR